MSENYYVGAYWPGRAEPLGTSAQRAEAFFRELIPLDPSLTRWFEQANSREAALKSQFTPDAETLLRLFQQKRYQTEPGWLSFAAWNGESAASSVVDFSCGSPSPRVTDACVLTPPSQGAAAERLLRAPVLARILRAMALAWEPDSGVVMSHDHLDAVAPGNLPDVLVGWVTYLSRRMGTVPPLPAPVRIEPVEDRGTLIILTPERFTASNPEHIALATQVRALLEHAGLGRPSQR